MKYNLLFFLLGIFLLVISANYASGALITTSPYCGDNSCTISPSLTENNPLTDTYCPRDCGNLVTPRFCEDTYHLIDARDCPVPVCSTSSGGGSGGSGGGGGAMPKLNNYWWVFLILGFIIGYYYKK